MKTRSVVIIGFMGSGKTTVAQELAGVLDCSWVDLDEAITQQEGKTPAEIITQEGEAKFRETETLVLRQVLTSGNARIVASGGGTWGVGENRKMIAEHEATVVWLDAPFELCWSRIEESKTARPLAPTRESAEQLYETRSNVYALGDVQIAVDETKTPKQIADEIVSALSQYKEQD